MTLEASGISEKQAAYAGVEHTTTEKARKLYPNLPATLTPRVWLFRYHDIAGKIDKSACRVRMDDASRKEFKFLTSENKYLQPKGTGCLFYFPRVEGVNWPAVLESGSEPIFITEGEKKALKATLEGFNTIGIGGVNSFVDKKLLHPILKQFAATGRRIYVVFDSDAQDSAHISAALYQFLLALVSEGADARPVFLPHLFDESDPDKTGLDTYLHVEGAYAFGELVKSAEPFSVYRTLSRFNREYAVVETPLSVLRLRQDSGPVQQWSPDRFYNYVEPVEKVSIPNGVDKDGKPKYTPKRAAQYWLQDYAGRNLVAGLAFRPGAVGEKLESRYIYQRGRRCLNLWSGWGATPVRNDELVRSYLRLVDHLFLNEYNSEPDRARREIYKHYFLSCLAYPIQNSGEKIEQAPVIVGIEGSGKSLVLRLPGALHGAGFVTIGEDQLKNNFNSYLLGRTFVQGEEVTGENQSRAYSSKLKHMLTGRKMMIEPKYVDAYEVDNLANFAFTSNDRDAFFLGIKGRRFFVYDVPNVELNTAFSFEELEFLGKQFPNDADCLNALMYFFFHFKIDEGVYRPSGLEPPETPAKRFMREQGKNDAQRWLSELITSDRVNPATGRPQSLFRSEDLLGRFHGANEHHKKHGPKSFTNAMTDYFFKPLGDNCPVEDCDIYPDRTKAPAKMKVSLWAIRPEYGGTVHVGLNKVKARKIWNEENRK